MSSDPTVRHRPVPRGLGGLFHRLATAPRSVLLSVGVFMFTLAVGLVVVGLMLYVPTTAAEAQAGTAPRAPVDFTPLASPPPAFASVDANALPTLPPMLSPTPPPSGPTAIPTPSVVPLDQILGSEAERSRLQSARIVSILLLGTDERPDEGELSRSDTIIVVLLDLDSHQATLISVPRDLWVYIPGYGEGRVNMAYFIGQQYGGGPELARDTVSQVLGISITETVVVDFDGFRQIVDRLGGIDVDVPEAIDDPLYPDYNYGTFRLVIPEGPNHFDGEQALRYARTRHGSSDLARAARQQLVIRAIRDKLMQPEHLTRLPLYLRDASKEVLTTLSLPDMFFLARFAADLDEDEIHMHVIESPLLWNGVTADGAQVLLYDPYSLQQAVQGWLWEAVQQSDEQ